MPNGPLRITGLPFDVAQYESEKKIEDEEILVRSNIYFFSSWYLCYFFRKFWLNQLLRSPKRRIRRSKLRRPQLKLPRLLPNSYKTPTSALFCASDILLSILKSIRTTLFIEMFISPSYLNIHEISSIFWFLWSKLIIQPSMFTGIYR